MLADHILPLVFAVVVTGIPALYLGGMIVRSIFGGLPKNTKGDPV